LSKELGSPIKPLKIKCLSIGRPSKEEQYLSIVSMDGRQFCFDLTKGQEALIHKQTVER
jgi:hypothetical protein